MTNILVSACVKEPLGVSQKFVVTVGSVLPERASLKGVVAPCVTETMNRSLEAPFSTARAIQYLAPGVMATVAEGAKVCSVMLNLWRER